MSNISKRVESIDLLRGIVIIIMALDHVRGYFHINSHIFNPTDLTKTDPFVFFTRWITHFCAPVFVFLAGVSAFMIMARKGKRETSGFLFKRGLWLILLELTVINFAWFFNLRFSFFPFGVIWVLGFCMVVLSLLVYLPRKLILVIGLLILFGHNLLDDHHVAGTSWSAVLWAFIHEQQRFSFGPVTIYTLYPFLPWVGIMCLGFVTGRFYAIDIQPWERKKYLLLSGAAAILLFIIIRAVNIYGDPSLWNVQNTGLFTLMSFVNTTKYPPSLLYSLMTLGPALVFLALMEKPLGTWSAPILHFGRVPMFFYILHLYLIHLLATVAMVFTEVDWKETIIPNGLKNFHPEGYGFSLSVVYLVWAFVILCLYPLCRWYDAYKSSHKEKWWLSYL